MGKVTPNMLGDTLVIEYDLELFRISCDSLKLQISSRQIEPNSDSLWSSEWFLLNPVNQSKVDSLYGSEWRGQLLIFGNSYEIPKKYRIILYEIGKDITQFDSTWHVKEFSFYPFRVGGAEAAVGVASSSLSGFPSPINSGKIPFVIKGEVQWGYYTHYYTWSFGYRINWSKRFSLIDYARFELQTNYWGRDRWMPRFHGALSYTRLKGKEDPNELIKKGVGLEAGVRFEGPFESFRYSYSTGAGGYHRADLILFRISTSGGQAKGGTMFSIYNGKYVKMIAISAYFSGWGDTDALAYRNKRPFWHKGLAWLALLPFLPAAFGS